MNGVRYLVAALAVLLASCSGMDTQNSGPNIGPNVNSDVTQKPTLARDLGSRNSLGHPAACTDPLVLVSGRIGASGPGVVNGYSCTTQVTSLTGSKTGVGAETPTAVNESTQQLYVSAPNAQTINIFPALATGNVSPTTSLRSNSIAQVSSLAIDQNGYLWVGNHFSELQSDILRFAPGVSGLTAPIQTITGGSNNTLFSGPYLGTLAVDSAGNVYTSNETRGTAPQNEILEFAATANGNAKPIRTIGGSNTGIGSLDGVAVDSNGRIIVSDYMKNTVRVFGANASGNATPIQIIKGSGTGLNEPVSIAVGPINNFYVTNVTTVTKYLASATGDASPVETITDSDGTAGLALCTCTIAGPKKRH
jgi:hypothetical protein